VSAPLTDTRLRQRQRTRRDLLEAAARLAREGRRPSLEEVAAEAMVSRATAYRYFPNVESLWTEAGVHIAFPDAEALLAPYAGAPPAERLAVIDDAMAAMIEANEPALRAMLAQSLERSLTADAPLNRQNRRSPMIEAALKPAEDDFDPQALKTLKRALAILMGTESAIAARDVLQLTPEEARETRQWAMRALVEAAMRRW
jgi:AcrR family transcriptional regulator